MPEELLAPLPVAAFLADAVLDLLAAARVVGAGLSLEEVCDFSPLVDEEVSLLLLDLKERLSIGILGAPLNGRDR
jgi:hypothetical protein